VTDDGCGIAPEMLDKIFDPFFTTKNKDHGTGLGLAVVHGTIKRHHGEIQVSSVLGKGTTFHVYLAVDGRQVAEVKEPVPVNVQGSERIMIVDDENSVTDVLTMMLKKVGYQIETYTDSIAAVRRFRKDPHCCDLVIIDMVMPNMTGAELAREFLALRADLPIIMLTGHSENFDFNRAQQVGIRAFLLKPVKMDKLRKIVRKVLEDGTYTDH
jgi:CheY-like chemotaxis protein